MLYKSFHRRIKWVPRSKDYITIYLENKKYLIIVYLHFPEMSRSYDRIEFKFELWELLTVHLFILPINIDYINELCVIQPIASFLVIKKTRLNYTYLIDLILYISYLWKELVLHLWLWKGLLWWHKRICWLF